MFKITLLFLLLLPFTGYTAFPEVDQIIGLAIQKKTLPGAVTVIGNKDAVISRAAFGKRDLILKNNSDTIYDLASLTKVVATATSIMILEEQGKLSIKDKVSDFFPEFKTAAKKMITIEDLLLHHSGLPASTNLVEGENYKSFISRVAGAALAYKTGRKTVYSDLGFLLLGEIVELSSGLTLDQFAQTYIFKPLKMERTGFHVAPELMALCAPTITKRSCLPHDPKSFKYFPENTGHAGVFSTGEDLSRFARMYLNLGSLDGVQIMKKETVIKMTSLTSAERALGWDMLSPYSNPPRGEVFPKAISYGHTGYTGTTMWIDPKSGSYYIFLSNRVLLGEEATAAPFTQLRRDLSTAIGKAIYKSSSI